MRNFFLILSLVIGSLSATAGNASLQDLIEIVNNTHKPDSLKISAYRDLVKYYQFYKMDSATYYANAANTYFTNKNYKIGIAYSIALLADIESDKGHYNYAIEQFQEALNLFISEGDKEGQIFSYGNIGMAFGRLGKLNEATRYFNTVDELSRKYKVDKYIANNYLRLGSVCELSNDLDKAMEYYNKSLEVDRVKKDVTNECYLYNNIGVVYAKKGDGKSAVGLFRRAYEMSKDNKSRYEVAALSLTNLGIAHSKFLSGDSSLYFFKQALALNKQFGTPEMVARVLLGIGNLYNDENKVDTAIGYFEEGYRILKTGEAGQGVLSDILDELSTAYKKKGDYKKAYEYLYLLKFNDDSVFNIEKTIELANLHALHELKASKEKITKLSLEHQKNELRRNLYIIVVASLVLIISVLFIYQLQTRKLNAKLVAHQKELEESNAVKDRLFSIIGHDLKGPVGSVAPLLEILEDDSTTAEERRTVFSLMKIQAEQTYEVLDKLLLWGRMLIKGSVYNPVSFLPVGCIEKNIQLLHAMANAKYISVKHNVSDGLKIKADADQFDFIIRNILSNAIKFTNAGGAIAISAVLDKPKGMATFSIKDNGVGMDEDTLKHLFTIGSSKRGTANEQGTSIGLMLCKTFVTENGGTIWVESAVGVGSEFFFTMPLAQE